MILGLLRKKKKHSQIMELDKLSGLLGDLLGSVMPIGLITKKQVFSNQNRSQGKEVGRNEKNLSSTANHKITAKTLKEAPAQRNLFLKSVQKSKSQSLARD
jgi:hypothetical protein